MGEFRAHAHETREANEGVKAAEEGVGLPPKPAWGAAPNPARDFIP